MKSILQGCFEKEHAFDQDPSGPFSIGLQNSWKCIQLLFSVDDVILKCSFQALQCFEIQLFVVVVVASSLCAHVGSAQVP